MEEKKYYSKYNNDTGSKQVWVYLLENGDVCTVSAVSGYITGDFASTKIYPDSDPNSVISDIDAAAKEYPDIYEIVFNHLVSGDKRSQGYVQVAAHCAEKGKCSRTILRRNFNTDYPEIAKRRTEEFKNAASNYEMRMKFLENRLEARQIEHIKPLYIREYDYWCDYYGERYLIREPEWNKPNDYGEIEPIRLPIFDENELADYLEKLCISMLRNDSSNEFFKERDEIISSYCERCEILKQQLEELGVSRDVRKHKYFDKEGREFEVTKPAVGDENDKGSFRVINNNKEQGKTGEDQER